MAGSLLQNPAAATYSGASTVGVTFGSSLTNGSVIIATVMQEDATGSSGSSVADSANAGGYTQDVFKRGGVVGPIGNGSVGIYRKANTGTSAATVTATLVNSTTGVLKVRELAGLDASPLDATASRADDVGAGSAANAYQPTLAITPTAAGDVIVAALIYYPGSPISVADPGFTANYSAVGSSSYHFEEVGLNVGGPGTMVLGFTSLTNPNQQYVSAAVAYKVASPTLPSIRPSSAKHPKTVETSRPR